MSITIILNKISSALDLTDFLVDRLENDIDYFKYTTRDGQVTEKQLLGKLCFLKILRNEKEFVNTELLDEEDRYRQLLTVQCYIAKQEC